MNRQEIDDLKRRVNADLRLVGQKFRMLKATVPERQRLRSEVTAMLERIAADCPCNKVLLELEPEVALGPPNGVKVLFKGRTPRARQFLAGEEF